MDAVIEIEGLTKSYGRIQAVAGLTLDVAVGESFGFLGPNGAGKTTTIRCLLGFIRPTAGRTRIFGIEGRSRSAGALSRVGYLPGEFGLWPSMTGAEVLEFLGRLHPRAPRARATLRERFEISHEDLDRQVRFYSRGMRQKLGIIQAFQHEPDLVVLDEPTEGLDPLMQDRFLGLLREHTASGRSVFMSSHILSEVEMATTRVAVVRDGRLVKIGPATDLTGHRARHCTVLLRAPARDGFLAGVPGVESLRIDDSRLAARFDFRGDMEPLLAQLSGSGVVEFLSEPESLAEAFFDVYGGRS